MTHFIYYNFDLRCRQICVQHKPGCVCFVSSDISEEWAQRWAEDFELNSDLHLPAENKFIGQYEHMTIDCDLLLACSWIRFDNIKTVSCLSDYWFNFFYLRAAATDFNLKTSDCPDSEFPVRIVNNERGCLWYKKDNKFKIPKGESRYHASCVNAKIKCFHGCDDKYWF